MQITFNTGRLYTTRGQVITAAWNPETRKILFSDHSRMIYGEIEPKVSANHEFTDLGNFIANVMNRYDAGDYRISVEAMQLREGDEIRKVRI